MFATLLLSHKFFQTEEVGLPLSCLNWRSLVLHKAKIDQEQLIRMEIFFAIQAHRLQKRSVWQTRKTKYYKQNRFFGGFASFARPLSSRVVCVVVYGKVPWLSLHAKYRTCKAKQAAAPFFSRSQHTHNKRKEKPATQRASSQVLFPFFTSKKLRVLIGIIFASVSMISPLIP